MIGRIDKYFEDRKYGFLTVEGRELPLWFHASDAQSDPALFVPGQAVEFTVISYRKKAQTKEKAIGLRVVEVAGSVSGAGAGLIGNE